MKKINKKGFTMIEILAAVIILGILTTIAIVTAIKTIEKSHKEYDQKQAELFTAAAEAYFTDDRNRLPSRLLTEKSVTLKQLIEQNYIEEVLDYNKKPYDQEHSIAYVKKTGTGKYIYYSILKRSADDKNPIKDNVEKNKISKNIKISISYDSSQTDRETTIDDVFYINKKLLINVSGSSTGDGISSYQYRIERLDEITSKEGNEYKISNEVLVNSKILSDTITINAKNLANGIYKVYVYAYDYEGKSSKAAESKVLVIDKTKPKCEISLSGTKGNEDTIEGKKVQWYKSDNKVANGQNKVTLKMTITDTYKYKNRLEKEEYTEGLLNTIKNYSTTVTKYQSEDTTQAGQKWYGMAEDKAGNIGRCNTTVYLDRELPLCKVTKTTDSGNEIGDIWTKENYTVKRECIDTNSLCNETSSTEWSKHFSVLDGKKDNSKFTPGDGNVYDRAGNEGICKELTKKLDKEPPDCNVSGGSDNWTNSSRTVTATCDDKGGVGCITNPFSYTYSVGDNGFKNLTTAGAAGEGQGGIVKDELGNSRNCPANQIVKIDKVKPTIFCTKGQGWVNGDTKGTASITVFDYHSGIAEIRHKKKDYDDIKFDTTKELYTDHNYMETLLVSYKQYQLTFGAKDAVGNNISKVTCYTNYDNLKPNTPTLNNVTFDENSNVLGVNKSCSNNTSSTSANICDVTATKLSDNDGKIIFHFSSSDQDSNTVNGHSGVSHHKLAHEYTDKASCTDYTTTPDNEKCSTWNQKKLVITSIDNANNESNTLTINITWKKEEKK